MNKISTFALVAALALAAPAFAQESQEQIHKDREMAHHDHDKAHNDRHDARQDRREARKDDHHANRQDRKANVTNRDTNQIKRDNAQEGRAEQRLQQDQASGNTAGAARQQAIINHDNRQETNDQNQINNINR